MTPRMLWPVVVLACALTGEVRLDACTCGPAAAPCAAAFQSPIVFAGQVQRIGQAETLDERSTVVRVTFVVSEVLRGAAAEIVDVYTPSSGPACGFGFSTGDKYLVYAAVNREGRLMTNRCMRTRPLAAAGEDLAYLRGGCRVRVVVPTGLGADSQQWPGTDPELFDPRGCGDLNFVLRPGRGFR